MNSFNLWIGIFLGLLVIVDYATGQVNKITFINMGLSLLNITLGLI